MIRLKTAVLIGFSLELGALLGGAPEKDVKALRAFGTNMGIGFQLKDDLLDAYADPTKFGKQIGGDILANKKTYLLIKAKENAKGKVAKELQSWLGSGRFRKAEKINAVKAIYSHLGIPAIVDRKINRYFRKAFKNLDVVSGKNERLEVLRSFSQALIDRQS
jgi:geranylgeranyl diphosphate synthase, type II